MKRLSRPMMLGVAALVIAAYSAAVIYLERSYVDPRPTGRKVRILAPPFERGAGLFFVKYGVKVEPGTVVYEDKEPLDPLEEGFNWPGQFQFRANGVVFSPTDGSDPNTSRRRYWLVTK